MIANQAPIVDSASESSSREKRIVSAQKKNPDEIIFRVTAKIRVYFLKILSMIAIVLM